MKKTFLLFLSFCIGICVADTEKVTAKVIKITDRGVLLQVNTEPIALEGRASTKYWHDKKPAGKDDFKAGETVYARFKSDEDPPELKELCDEVTWKWLEAIRKSPQRGTVEKVDSKYVTVKFADGSKFSYRATDKTDVKIGSKQSQISDLKTGMTINVKGRTLPTLDVFAVLISDEAIAVKASKTTSDKRPLVFREKLAATGTISGQIVALHPEGRMFDIDQGGRVLHISYTASTTISLNANPGKTTDLQVGRQCAISYKRDKVGRILAQKVDVSAS